MSVEYNINDLYSKNVEDSLIGLLLSDFKSNIKILNTIKVDDFFQSQLQVIYKSILELNSQQKVIDIVTVSELLKFNNELVNAGGYNNINDLALNSLDNTTNIDSLIKIIIKYSKKRKLLNLCNYSIKELNNSIDVNTVGTNLYNTAQEIINRTTDSKFKSISTGIVSVVDNLTILTNKENRLLGLDTSFNKLNTYISGLCPGRLYILAARPSVGKGYGLDTLTLTPTGWVKNRDIKLGDIVIGRDGEPTKVIGIYPQPLQDCYKITLKDGREVICDAPHEWTVYSSKWGRERTFTAEELYQKLQCVRYKNRISLPKFTGDYGIEKDFVIPPYIMGVLIGDGCLSNGDLSYCKPSRYVLEEVRKYLPNGVKANFRSDNKMVGITGWSFAKRYIKQVGLNTQCWNKFIPQEYFHSSKTQREKLLKGLLDTDGWNTGKGWEYSTTSRQLAKDVQQLAWSLGYCAKIKERTGKYKAGDKIKETRTNYRVFIATHNPITITKMEKVEPIPTQCIHVDNKDNLFVIEDYIVTHNSALAQQIAEQVALNSNVLFFSLEMGIDEYTQRSIYRRSGYNQQDITQNIKPIDSIMDSFMQAADSLDTLKLNIIDDSECTLNTVEKNIINCKAQYGSCDFVVIDYLQLMGSDNKYKVDDYARITANSIGLKRLARKYNVPILALSQVSRACEQRQDKRPLLSDLRESGSIEQDADVVMFLYRDEIYNPRSKGTAELIIAKNRQGDRGRIIPMYFNNKRTQFMEQ